LSVIQLSQLLLYNYNAHEKIASAGFMGDFNCQ